MRSLRRRLCGGLALVALAAAGCKQGPSSEVLKGELQARFDRHFEPGLFEIRELARNGSYPFTEGDDPRQRLLVYFKARIAFAKDYSLARWDTLNAGALATLLGAAPEGIEGIEPDGNSEGDLLRVHGSATYVREGERWVPLEGPGPKFARARRGPVPADEEGPLVARLRRIGEAVRYHRNRGHEEHLRVLEQELEEADRTIHLRLDRLDGRMSLMTAGAGSEYRAVGEGLEKVRALLEEENGEGESPPGLRAYPSAGSVENCRLVGERLADFAIVQNDVARLAYAGAALFAGLPPMPELRAVATLFPEAIHLVTREGAGIRSVRDLEGKRVSLGAPGSGTRLNAQSILAAYSVTEHELGALLDLGTEDAVAALEAGEIDALFVTRAYPAPLLEAYAAENPMRLVPIGGVEADRLAADLPYFPRMVLAAHTYVGQEEDVPTLGVTAMLVTRADVPGERVAAMLEVLFARPEVLARETTVSNFITRKTARLGVSIPLHPTAEAALGE